ncbi:MAG TPA: hypothetical protein VK211_03985 [Kamptonema sp.]|nr:hypothetical protein [Kamptonema sp.]
MFLFTPVVAKTYLGKNIKSMSGVIEGDGFTIKTDKFDFFFGRITSSPDNQRRSLDNLNGLLKLGIDEQNNGRERLLQIFHEGLNGTIIKVKRKSYGITVLKKI